MRMPVAALLAIIPSPVLLAADPPTQYVNRRSNTLGLTNVADPAAVASAALFSTNDGGRSWQLVEEVAAPADGKSVPRFTFTVPADGTYGLYSRTVFRSGHREADPRPGTSPLYVVVIDSTPPAFSTTEVRLVGTAAGMARIHATWSLTEANPVDPPVTIEMRAADGRFLPIGTGSMKGALELSVPVPTGATTIQVRFSATDRAGNAVQTAPTVIALTPPQLSGATREALAQAVKDMPTLAELGVGKATKPTTTIPSASHQPTHTQPPAQPRPTPPAVTPPPPVTEPVTAPPTVPAAEPPPAIPAAEPPPAVPVMAKPVEDGLRPPPPKLTYVSGSQADDLLRDARVAVRFDRFEEALDFYDRVLSSSRIEDGIHDLVHLLTRLRRPKDLCTLVHALPPEYHDDQVRLEHGRALVSLGRHAEAEGVLNGIGSRSLEAREARLLIARCWRAGGREADARALFTTLARGDDAVARMAQEALAGR